MRDEFDFADRTTPGFKVTAATTISPHPESRAPTTATSVVKLPEFLQPRDPRL